MIDIATVAVIALPSATIGAFLAYTFLPRKGEGSPNPCDYEALQKYTIGLQQDLFTAQYDLAQVRGFNIQIEAQNRGLHIDMAEKAKRLSDAGLQSAGGCDE